MIRVLIVDDHQLMRQGVTALLMKAKDIKVVGEARDGLEAIDLAEQKKPEIILMDIEMPRLNGIRTTGQLRETGNPARVIMLSMRSDCDDVRQAVQNGARGYLFKNSSREELITAIRIVYEGGTFFSPGLEDCLNGKG